MANGIAISYDLVGPPSTGNLADTMTDEGIKGYAFLRTWFATGSPVVNIFANADGMNSKYFVDQLPAPTDTDDYLMQLNQLGEKGYRIKKQLVYSTGSITAYIKDTERPDAKYDYRFEATVTDVSSFNLLVNQLGADGYRFYDTNIFNRTWMIFIKDTSQTAPIVYQLEPVPNSTNDFLTEANGLGLKWCSLRRFYSSI